MNRSRNIEKQKQWSKTWIKGFTLLEMLIVILLTAIVVSMAFLYFNTFNRYIAQINHSSEVELQILRFESLLSYDIDRAEEVLFDLDETTIIEFVGINTSYHFSDSFISRKQDSSVDTLKFDEIVIRPEYFSDTETLLKGFELILKDGKKRERVYYFNIPASAKQDFKVYWLNK